MAEGQSWGRGNRRQRRETARELAKELVRQRIQQKGKFSAELTLALAATVITILLVLIAPQSKWTTGIWLAVVFGLGIYPMLHLGNWALKKIKWEWLPSVLAMIVWAAGMTLLALHVWPSFHRHILSPKERAEFEAPLKAQKTDQQEIHLACPTTDEKPCEFATQRRLLRAEAS